MTARRPWPTICGAFSKVGPSKRRGPRIGNGASSGCGGNRWRRLWGVLSSSDSSLPTARVSSTCSSSQKHAKEVAAESNKTLANFRRARSLQYAAEMASAGQTHFRDGDMASVPNARRSRAIARRPGRSPRF